MTTLRVVIADDEPIARRGLLRLLGKASNVEVVGEAGDGATALKLIQDSRPNVAFLDVQMPGGTGLEVARALEKSERPAIVFVTAYDRFAIEAFEVHAVDYLLKPFDEDRFSLALERVRDRLQANANRDATSAVTQSVNERLDALLSALSGAGTNSTTKESAISSEPSPLPEDTFIVRDGERVIFVPLLELDWCEAADNYVRLHTKGKKHLVRETMRNIEERLTSVRSSQARFARIHRSMIVNLSRVREIKPAGGGEYSVTLADGTKLVLSRGYREKVLSMLGFPE